MADSTQEETNGEVNKRPREEDTDSHVKDQPEEPPSKLAKTNIAEQDKDSGTNSDEKTSMESTGEHDVTNEEPKGENDETHDDDRAVVAHEDAEAEAVVLKEEVKEDSVQPKLETESTGEAAPGVVPLVLPADPSSIPETPEGPASLPGGLPPGLPGADEASPVNPPSYVNEDANPEAIIEEKGEVSSLYIGRVIGKGGEMIRDLQARSGARIDVDQSVPPGMPRVITYRGTRKTVDFAKRLVHMLCQENVNEADLPLGEAKREYLIVPASSVGKIIGRGGEMIRELQNRSHAKIQVDHSGSNGMGSNEKRVTVTGTEQAVVKAKEMVLFLVANPVMDAMQSLNMLIEDKVQRGGVWGSGPPYLNLPQNGQNMQPGPSAYGYDQSYYVGTPTGATVGHGAPSASYGAPVQGTPYAAPAAHSYQQPPPSSFGGGVESEVFLAPRNYMGRIIGSKGVTINDLQRRSACDIQINQDLPPGRDCEITIRGTRQGIEMAKQMLREIIEVGPSHPYAGGTGGGQSYGGYPQQGGYGMVNQGYGGYQNQGYGRGGYDQQGYGQPAYGQPGGYATAQQYPPARQYSSAPQASYGAPPMNAPLVPEWKSATSPDGQIYYYNERTGETTWQKPAGVP